VSHADYCVSSSVTCKLLCFFKCHMRITLFLQVSHGGLLCFCQLVLFPNSVTDLIQGGCQLQHGWPTKEATEKIERSKKDGE